MNRINAFQLREAGILLLRIGLGVILLVQGFPEIFGGPEGWKQAGQFMNALGISAMPVFFGFMSGIIKIFGGICLIFGLFFRTALSLLTLLMIFKCIAALMHSGTASISPPLVLIIVFISLGLMGPGTHNVDKRMKKRNAQRRF